MIDTEAAEEAARKLFAAYPHVSLQLDAADPLLTAAANRPAEAFSYGAGEHAGCESSIVPEPTDSGCWHLGFP